MQVSLPLYLAILGASSLGCLPIKYDFRAAPAVDGRLTREGQPAAEVGVHFGNANDAGRCSAPREAVTDVDGRFHIDAKIERGYVAFVDRFPASSLCIEPPGGAVATWSFGHVDDGLAASCELGPEAPGPVSKLETLPPGAPSAAKGCRIEPRPRPGRAPADAR